MKRKTLPGEGQISWLTSADGVEAIQEHTQPFKPPVPKKAELLAPGIRVGDSTDVVKYFDNYVRAVKAIGRARSNDIGFGALDYKGKIVGDFAKQIDNPDRQEVQKQVVDNRKMYLKKAGNYLMRRSDIRQQAIAIGSAAGLHNQAELMAMPLPESEHMLEGQWFGDPSLPSNPDLTKARTNLYRGHDVYMQAAEQARRPQQAS